MTLRGGGRRRFRTTALGLVAVACAGCFGGGDSEARTAVEQLRDALVTPDAAAVRELLADRSRSTRMDLLTDEVVADNAFAGRDVTLEADLDRYNGYGRFDLVAEGSPAASLSVNLRLTSTTAPAALPTVGISFAGSPTSLLVDDHEVPLTSPDRPGNETPTYYLPPGSWTIALPSSRFATSVPQEVVVLESRDRPSSIALRTTLSDVGRDEVLSRAEAYVAACEKPQTSPRDACGGETTLCVNAETTRTVTFIPRPQLTVTDDADPRVAAQDDLRRTVTTTCTDRDSGAVLETTTREDTAVLVGVVDLTPPDLAVDFG